MLPPRRPASARRARPGARLNSARTPRRCLPGSPAGPPHADPRRARVAGRMPTWPPRRNSRTCRAADVRLTAGLIAECGPGLRPEPGEEVMEAGGGVLLPGLHDHHVHLRALAAAAASVSVGPPLSGRAAELAARLRAADADLPPGAWLRAVGYHESVAGSLDRHRSRPAAPPAPGAGAAPYRRALDGQLGRRRPARPRRVRAQRGGTRRRAAVPPGGCGGWTAGSPAGCRGDRGPGRGEQDGGDRSAITGFTDATPGATGRDLAFLADAPIAQRLCCMAPPGGGPATGAINGGTGEDHARRRPPCRRLTNSPTCIRAAHAAGRPAAVHCVTRVQLVLTLAALDLAGRLPGDRIEHGAVIGADSLPGLDGLTVVTQPHFVAERGEQYAADVPPNDRPDLWRLRSLIDAGVAVAAGSDAPFGSEDPWHAMRAAVRRPALFAADEAVSPARALALFLGEPAAPATQRLVAPGRPADLALLRAGPVEALHSLGVRPGGRDVHRRRAHLRPWLANQSQGMPRGLRRWAAGIAGYRQTWHHQPHESR